MKTYLQYEDIVLIVSTMSKIGISSLTETRLVDKTRGGTPIARYLIMIIRTQ